MEKWIRKIFKQTIRSIEQQRARKEFQAIIDDMKARPYMRKCRRRVIRLYKKSLREMATAA
jgi:hypothetical protein